MAFVTSATIPGKSRTDGSTARTVTMTRVSNVSGGFVLRESGVPVHLAQTVTHRTAETRQRDGSVVRHSQSTWSWPFEATPGTGIVAGTVNLSKTGLHVPSNTPAFVRNDILTQLSAMASSSSGTIGHALTYGPMTSGDYPF